MIFWGMGGRVATSDFACEELGRALALERVWNCSHYVRIGDA